MKQILNQVIEPTLIINEQIVRKNLKLMAEKAHRNSLALRPHCKTHQSHTVARWMRDYDIHALTVSSIRMAQYFANDGWDDITIAFPINVLEVDRINELADKIKLNIIVESAEAVNQLNSKLKASVNAFIKADTGYHRTGLRLEDADLIDETIEALEKAQHINFLGFLSHAGHSYGARGKAEIEAIHNTSLTTFQSFRDRYESTFPNLVYSAGDTPTCSAMDHFPVADELRPGNFVFYDLSQYAIGSCSLGQIAVLMACPVVAIHKNRNEVVIYGGGVHFSKDRKPHPIHPNDYYGLVADWATEGWKLSQESDYIKSLSQEHGILKVKEATIDNYKVGDIIGVAPIHSCMTANLMKRYLTLDGKWIEMMQYP
ncbi:MAG: alanine racemase [Bacteroidota bacterium]